MSNEELSRVGVACVIAALSALVEAQLELCSGEDMFRNAVFWWLLMIVGCGVVIDATKGSTKKVLFFSSAMISSAFLGTGAFMSVMDVSGNFCFSGVTENHPAFIPLTTFVWLITCLAVFLLSFSSPVIKNMVFAATKDKTVQQIENVEKSIRAIIAAIATLVLFLQIV
jgi:hypothetical protein